MIKSMTGFGSAKRKSELMELSVETKSLNHRFFDLKIKQFKEFFTADIIIRQETQKIIKRGKVDIFFDYKYINDEVGEFVVNKDKLGKIESFFNEIEKHFSNEISYSFSDILRFKDNFIVENYSWGEKEKSFFLSVVADAIKSLDEMRIKEGKFIEDLLVGYIKNLETILNDTEKIYIDERDRIRENMKKKIVELLEDKTSEDNRLEQELFYYFEKVDIEEEISRLKSHFQQFKNILLKGGVVGRKLDFLAQEMFREVNTIASKSQNYSFIESVVEMKSEIEKIREQVQNIE